MPRAIVIDKASPFFGERCALCKNTFAPGEEIIVCAECGTRHHTFCWQEVGNHCTAYGCTGHGEIIRPNQYRPSNPRPPVQPQVAATETATAATIDPPRSETRPVRRRRPQRQAQSQRREQTQSRPQQTVISGNAATERVPWHMRWAQSCLIISIAIAILLFGFGCFGLWAIADYLLLDVFDMPYRAVPQNALPSLGQIQLALFTFFPFV